MATIKMSEMTIDSSIDGTEQVGTKVYFVKEDAEQIKGKAMVLPVRPWQSSDSTAESSGVSTASATSATTSTSTATATTTETSTSTDTSTM